MSGLSFAGSEGANIRVTGMRGGKKPGEDVSSVCMLVPNR